MKIVFSKDEIAEILKREAEVMVMNYHVGEAEYSIRESTNYMSDVTIDVELKEPVTVEMDESDLLEEANPAPHAPSHGIGFSDEELKAEEALEKSDAEDVNHTHDVDVGIYDPIPTEEKDNEKA